MHQWTRLCHRARAFSLRFCALVSVIILEISGVSAARAQWISPFAAPGADEEVLALALHDDGTGPAMYMGGWFHAIDSQVVNKVVKWTGKHWEPLGSGVGWGAVLALLSFKGDLIASGGFTTIGGVPANNIARWSGGAWHPMDTGLSGGAAALAVYNGELIAGTSRWDGQAWHSLGSGISPGVVVALTVYRGELIAAGQFTSAGGVPAGNIARWNGVSWSAVGAGFDFPVRALAVYNGELIAAGEFFNVGGMPVSHIARWNGTAWQTLSLGLDSFAYALAVHQGHLIVGGPFRHADHNPAKGIAQWDGSAWSSLGADIVGGRKTPVRAILPVASTNELFVGGAFSLVGSIAINGIARYHDGEWSRLTECVECMGVSGWIRSLVVFDDGTGEALYAGGQFNAVGNQPASNLARWDGHAWSALGSGANHIVSSMAVFDDGSGGRPQLYVAGFFTQIDGVPVNHLARWDGKRWQSVGGGLNSAAVTMTVYDDGSGPALYLGGQFTISGSQVNVVKWDGRTLSPFSVASDMVMELQSWAHANGSALIALLSHSMRKWQAGAWTTLATFTGPGNPILSSLAFWPPDNGESLVVCGGFNDIVPAGGLPQTIHRLALWDGATWQDLHPPTASVSEGIKVFSFEAAGCNDLIFDDLSNPQLISRWNGYRWLPMGSGLADSAQVIYGFVVGVTGPIHYYFDCAIFQGMLYVAGDFNSAGGLPAANIAIWDIAASHACPGDTNRDGQVNINDLLDVITHWGPCADCAADSVPCGGNGVVNVDDLIAVITGWGPCP